MKKRRKRERPKHKSQSFKLEQSKLIAGASSRKSGRLEGWLPILALALFNFIFFYAISGAAILARLLDAPSLSYFWLREIYELDLAFKAGLQLLATLLAGSALFSLALQSGPRAWQLFKIFFALICFFFQIQFLLLQTLNTGASLELALYLLENPALLLEGPSLLAATKARTWILLLFFWPLLWLTGRIVRAIMPAPDTRTKASWKRSLRPLLPVPALLLAAQLELFATGSTSSQGQAGTTALIPDPALLIFQERKPELYFARRFGYTIKPPEVIVIFMLESARAEFVDLEQSHYFSSVNPEALKIPEFFVPVPHSSNSHYSLFTGLYSSRKAHENFKSINARASLPGMLAEKQYRSIYLYGGDSSFDREHIMIEKLGLQNIDMRELSRRLKQKRLFWWGLDDRLLLEEGKTLISESRGPLFLTIVYTNSHHPYPQLPVKKAQRFSNKDPQGRHRNAIDYAIELSDNLLDHIKKSKKSYLAILLSDHGESFGEHGFIMHDFSLYNTEVKVPFAMSGRGLERLYGKLPQTGSILDVYPTIADMLGVPLLAPLHGQSLFDPDYKLNLLLRSWTNSDYSGLILDSQKWIYSAIRKKLSLYNMGDTEIQTIRRQEARAFVKRLQEFEFLYDRNNQDRQLTVR